jgi:hypothetical protein
MNVWVDPSLAEVINVVPIRADCGHTRAGESNEGVPNHLGE